jgi:predicted  nucleic acid-binding Zn-ribbon protein
VREHLRILAKLATIDGAARDLDKELKEVPERIGEMQLDVRKLEELLSKERQQLVDAEKMRTSGEEEIAARNESLSRSRAKAAKARNAREAEATEREVETVRRMIKEREGDREKLAAAIEEVKKSLAGHEAEFNELRTMFAAEEEKGRARIAELQEERSKVVVGRDELTVKLPRDILRRYEMIRQKRGVGVTEILDGTCQSCRMQIPPQQYIVLQRAENLDQCPSCNRIMYHRSALED